MKFLKKELDNYLHRNTNISEIIEKKIKQAEHERKAMAGVKKLAKERAKKANLHNKNLRDCRVHYNDLKMSNSKFLKIIIIYFNYFY